MRKLDQSYFLLTRDCTFCNTELMTTKTFPYKGGQYEGEAAGNIPHGTGTIKYPSGKRRI